MFIQSGKIDPWVTKLAAGGVQFLLVVLYDLPNLCVLKLSR